MTARHGSMCSGAGMLDRALESLFDVDAAWQAEIDRAAAAVLRERWPGVPNLGDITAIGGPYGLPRRHIMAPRRDRRTRRVFDRRVRAWRDQVERVEILSAGFPCQPFSAAGRRGGSADERHLWPIAVLPGITALLPPVVVLENVPNLLTIESGTVFGRIIADLDELGYSVAWTMVGACKVGACHHRHRLFILAVRSGEVRVPSSEPLAERHGLGWAPIQQVLFGDVSSVKWTSSGVSRGGLVWPLPVDTCGDNGIVLLPTPTAVRYGSNQSPSAGAAVRPSLDQIVQMLPTPTARIAQKRGTPSAETAQQPMESGRRNLEDAIALLPTPRATDTGTAGRRASEGWRPPLSQVILPMFPTPTARDATRGAGRPYAEGRPLSEVVALLPSASDARSVGLLPTPRASDAAKGGPNQRGSSGDLMLPAAVQPGRFGKYEAAVRRHEFAFNMPVPPPTEPGRAGKPRLAAPFPEWMMVLPGGWLTDVVPRNDAIRIAGNGVVGAAVEFALPTLPTFPVAVSLLAAQPVGVAA